MDIYRGAKHHGIYLALATDPEGDNCFSSYQNNEITSINQRLGKCFRGISILLRMD